MKVLAVGDAFVTDEHFRDACKILADKGHHVEVISWGPKERAELETINRYIEQEGPFFDDTLVDVDEAVRRADIILVDFCPVPAELMDSLKLIGVCRANVSNVDVEEASRRNIPVINVVGRNAIAVAEFTIGLMLAESRHIARGHASLMDGKWRKAYSCEPCEIEGKNVGLVGFGAIAQTVARKLSSFGCSILFYDPYVDVSPTIPARKVSLEELLQTSDFVSIHCRLTEGTKGLIGAKELSLMRPSAYIINTGRAEIIDSEALYNALRAKRIRGAALDVFCEEPLPEDDPLLALDNVTLTPHLAGSTPESLEKSPVMLVENVLAFLENGDRKVVLNSDNLDWRQAETVRSLLGND
jgi:D-3-phosphoglycerate dehydrogenase